MKPSIEKMTLFSNMLEEGYRLRLQVTGASMSPFLETGSYVTLSRAPLSELKIGDVIFCTSDDGSFKLHRLLLIKNNVLITKGDALGCPDKPFDTGDYQGKVILIEQHRPHAVIIRDMEVWSSRAANYLIAIFHRFNLHLIGKYFALMTKPA